MFGDITIKSRPLRLAFFIPPTKAALRYAIQVNCTLWGGVFNPIIPLFSRAPATWKQYPGERISVERRIRGYIRAFDPDVLVDCTNGALPPYLATLGRPIVKIDDIWASFYSAKEPVPKYGIGIFELFGAIYSEYFEAVLRFPWKIGLPSVADEHALFWAAAVGELPSRIQEEIEEEFSKAIDIEKPELSAETYDSIVRPRVLFPRGITRHQLETEGSGYRRHEAYGFYMDLSNVADIVDFWNLRALGRSVLPIPKQFAEIPEWIEHTKTFVRRSFRINRKNPSVTFGTTIIRSFSTTMPELEAFASALQVQQLIPDKPDARILALQHWYPRIWDEWAMGKDHATPDGIVAQAVENSFPEVGDTVSLEFLKPEFLDSAWNDTPRLANELYPRFYGHGENVRADVLPYDHGEEVLRVVGGGPFYSNDEFRIGRSGPVHLVGWKKSMRWTPPQAEPVFFAWLTDKGFKPELSTCGRLAKQMHAQLQGWLSVLTNEPLVALFDTMAKGGEDGKGAPLGEVKGRIRTIGHNRDDLYRSLNERHMFQLGYKTQCIHCGRNSWFSIDDLAVELTCPLCHKKLDAISAVDSANRGAWHLRMAGPFSVEKFADGGYSVLLALHFFQQDHSLQTTPVMSFTAKHEKTGKELEADLGLLWQETAYGDTEHGVLFAECKSYNSFQRKDFERMSALAEQFPGAILAFCTLRRTLSATEIREIKRIANAGRKYWKPERPINPVLVLTGQELFNHFGAPTCWRDAQVPEWTKNVHTLLDICNATQAIYLGLPHWQETWSKEFAKKRERKQKGKAAPSPLAAPVQPVEQ